MRESRILCSWDQGHSASLQKFHTAVSLHSHTLHSRESLDFIDRTTANTPWLAGAIRKQKEKYRAVKGRDLNLKRAWWRPPLSARQAFDLERKQIEYRLGMDAMVSISDHDNIDAGLQLSMIEETRQSPISIEWTIPYRGTFFHVGIHNLPGEKAPTMARAMNEFTETPDEARIGAMLEWLGQAPESLIILNHPMWDENHIGETAHIECVTEFLENFRPFLHAAELNGLRPWSENRKAAQLAACFALPVVSGGDRHGKEPNACLNLTNAGTFAEFVTEIRHDGWSDVVLMPQYREPLRMRILENMCAILEDEPGHALGWLRWSDRVFYLTDEGIEKSLTEFFGGRYPTVINRFVSLMQLVKHRRVRSALRLALNEKWEFGFESGM